MKKYKLGESKDFNGKTLYRVVALISFGSVSAGDVGGWIEKESNLSHYNNAWVSDNAQVSGDAWVVDNAQVSGNAWVLGDARVSGDALVSGNAQVLDNSRVSGDAQVSDNAWVSGDARVSGNAWVLGKSRVSDNAQVLGNSRVSGNAQVLDNSRVSGDARVSGNAWVLGDARVSGNAQVSKLAQTLRTKKYHITISDTHVQIDCKCYTFGEWENFDNDTISEMDDGALKWWKMYKPIIFSIIKAEDKM